MTMRTFYQPDFFDGMIVYCLYLKKLNDLMMKKPGLTRCNAKFSALLYLTSWSWIKFLRLVSFLHHDPVD